MKRQNKLSLAIALALITGSLPIAAAQSAADFQDEEYYKSGGLNLINAAEAYALGYTGKGVTLGICDMPINFQHPELLQKAKSGMVNLSTYAGGSMGVYPWDVLMHGSHVAGIAAASRDGTGMQGIAYESEIAGSNVQEDYSTDGSFVLSRNLYRYYLQDPEIKVINNSWEPSGKKGENYFPDIMGDEAAKKFLVNDTAQYTKQIAEAVKADKLLIFAAGNTGHPTANITALCPLFLPETANQLIMVTNVNNTHVSRSGEGTLTAAESMMAYGSDLAKYAEDYTLTAPGKNIFSLNANYATDGVLYIGEEGTSMATPFVTGTGALVQQAFPYMSAKQIGDVLLSTANSEIQSSVDYSCSLQKDVDAQGNTSYQVNVFNFSAGESDAAQEMVARFKASLEKSGVPIQKVNLYYNVPLQELIGQGVVDAGAAVEGPGALNARRLSSSDISSSYTVNGTAAQQALYSVDTQDYDSVWSNDIKEIKAGYIASDSTEADLQARWKYYDTNWLSYTGTDRDTAKSMTQLMMELYNQQVKDSGLAGLHVGLYKSGAGTLALTGANTYAGSNIAAGGTLEIDGSVAGDAWSITNSSTGKTGTISGSGIIKGNLYNHGIAQPTAAGNLTVNGTLTSDGALGLVTVANGQSAHQIVVGGAADIKGSTLQSVTGSSYLPDKSYTFLTASGGITGSLTNTAGSAFSGLLNIKNLNVGGTSGAVTLGIANNIGNLNPDQQWGYDNLSTLLTNTQGDSTKQTQIGWLLGASPSAASAGLTSAAQANSPDGAALTMSSLTAMNAIGARTMYLSTTGMTAGSSVSSARSDATVTKESSIIPIDLGPTTSGWLKFSKSWESIGNSDTNGHGFATSFGFDHSVGNSWRLGEFFSYGDNSFAGTNSSLKNKDYRLGIYGIREKGPSQIFLYLDAGRQNNDSKRYISAGANYMAESSYKSNTIELGGRYTYDTDYGKSQSWHRKPYGESQVGHYNQDGYDETGAGVWNQSVGSGSSTYSAATVGFGLEKRMKNEEIEVHVGYKRVLSGSDPTYPVHWMDGGAEHVVRGSGLDKNLLVVGVHAEQKQDDNWNLSGDIELEQGHSQQNVQASVMLKKSW